MAIALNGNSIPLGLADLGITHNAAPDMSSYANMVASWRSQTEVEANGDTYAAYPTEAALQTAVDGLETDDTQGYADGMRSERDTKITECDSYRSKYVRQSDPLGDNMNDAARIAAADGVSDAQYATVLTYVKDLANLPANIVTGPAGTYGTFDAPIWPAKPSELG